MFPDLVPPRQHPKPPQRIIAVFLAALLAAASLTLVGLVRDALAANAASWGVGHQGMTPNGSYLGNYLCDGGTPCYCIDSNRQDPVDVATDGGTMVGAITTNWGHTYSGTELQKINYVISTHGTTNNPDQAAAVAAYVYSFTSSYARDHGAGYNAGAYYIDGHVGTLTSYNQIWSDVEANWNAGGDGSATVSIEMTDDRSGVVSVTTTPATASAGELRLTGAVVEGGAASVQVTNGASVAIVGTPAAGALEYTVGAQAVGFSTTGAASASVRLHHSGDRQRVLSSAGVGIAEFSSQAVVTEPIVLAFSPIVRTTVASREVGVGERFVDTLTASVAEGSSAWMTLADGSAAAITARGTLFGPFLSAPSPGSVPADAPVVGTETVALTGPGDYTSPGTLTAARPGFYTWVWSIAAADQSPDVAAFLTADYAFADTFGLVEETHVVPMRVTAVSQASAATVGFGETVTDQLTVTLEQGDWLLDGAEPVPAVFRGTAYFVPGDAAPPVSTSVPEGTLVLGTTSITATAPGAYPADLQVVAPATTAGYITWVWTLDASEFMLAWADDFGLPAETTRVEPPRVSTVATPAVMFGQPASDTALVEGSLPATPPALVFEAYLQPADATAPVCEADNRVFGTLETPVAVDAVGEYRSPEVAFTKVGTYYWVESLIAADGFVLHRGECGLPNETTVVSAPPLPSAGGERPQLAVTGADPAATAIAGLPLWVLALALVGAGGALAMMRSRARRAPSHRAAGSAITLPSWMPQLRRPARRSTHRLARTAS